MNIVPATQHTAADSAVDSSLSTEDTPTGRRLEHTQPAAQTAGGNDNQLQPLVNEHLNSSKHAGAVQDDSGWAAARSQLGTLTSQSEQQVPVSMLPDERDD
jgi:hypothetical protein